MALCQIAYKFKEKILRYLMGNHRDIFYENGISNLSQLQDVLDGRRALRGDATSTSHTTLPQIDEVRAAWIASAAEIEVIRKQHHYGTKEFSLNTLHMLIKDVKKNRDALSHTGLTEMSAEELRVVAREMLSDADFAAFSFILALNEWISEKRSVGIWDW